MYYHAKAKGFRNSITWKNILLNEKRLFPQSFSISVFYRASFIHGADIVFMSDAWRVEKPN